MELMEIYLIQNVAPANLNRDDTGSPKDAIFGGFRRARISSQAQKRASRVFFKDVLVPRGLLSEEELAVRTKRVVEELSGRLAKAGKDEESAKSAALAALGGIGLGTDGSGLTEYMLFLGKREIEALSQAILANWDAVKEAAAKQGDKKGKKKAKSALPAQVKNALSKIFDGGKAVDLALFGRMLADRPEWNVDASCQVAHALSTHKVEREFDFYTAVDDLNPAEETGAGMMGDIEFLSSCFYRYADLNLSLLTENLQGDRELAIRSAIAFLEAFIKSLPTGKQNSFAAHNLPDFVAVRISRDDTPRNLTNAFLKPVFADKNGDLLANSVARLEDYWKRLDDAYGKAEDESVMVLNLSSHKLSYLKDCKNLKGLLDEVKEVLEKGGEG